MTEEEYDFLNEYASLSDLMTNIVLQENGDEKITLADFIKGEWATTDLYYIIDAMSHGQRALAEMGQLETILKYNAPSKPIAELTETVEKLEGSVSGEQEKVLEMQAQVSELQHTVDGLSVTVQEQFAGGMNYIRNSAGLNGITDDWTTTGTVSTDSSTDVQNNTTSDSCFVLGSTSTLTQVITGAVTGTSYAISLKAKKTGASYSSYFYVKYNGNKTVYLFNTTSTFGWTEYRAIIPDVTDSTITIYAYNRLASLYISDIMLVEGSTIHKWTPAPNEIYTTEVKIDRRGIEVSNADSQQRTVISNTEFSGYYNEEVIFTLNKDETKTKKTTVDGELTVGKTKFVPMPTASEGLNIVILD
jgi:hypothetical protein